MHECGQHGNLVSKPFLQYKDCEKYLKMCKFDSFCHLSPKKDKITKLQNAMDQPPSVQFFF